MKYLVGASNTIGNVAKNLFDRTTYDQWRRHNLRYPYEYPVENDFTAAAEQQFIPVDVLALFSYIVQTNFVELVEGGYVYNPYPEEKSGRTFDEVVEDTLSDIYKRFMRYGAERGNSDYHKAITTIPTIFDDFADLMLNEYMGKVNLLDSDSAEFLKLSKAALGDIIRDLVRYGDKVFRKVQMEAKYYASSIMYKEASDLYRIASLKGSPGSDQEF